MYARRTVWTTWTAPPRPKSPPPSMRAAWPPPRGGHKTGMREAGALALRWRGMLPVPRVPQGRQTIANHFSGGSLHTPQITSPVGTAESSPPRQCPLMGALRAPPVGTQDRDALSRLRGWPFPIPIVGAAPRGALRSARRHATAPARHACSCSAGVSAASLPSGGQDGRYGRGHLGQRVHPRPRGPRGHPARGRQRCEILQSVCGA